MKLLILLFGLFFGICTASAKVYTFAVVPQYSATQIKETWQPFLNFLSEKTGEKFELIVEKTIPLFEEGLKNQKYDFAYANPYHFVYFNKIGHYHAFARAKDKKIEGIIVVKKDLPIESIKELEGKQLAFPAPAAFAATLLNLAELKKQGIITEPTYVKNHENVYKGVARGLFTAGGGVKRTFNVLDNETSSELKILHTTKAYTPHAFVYHSRVNKPFIEKIQSTLILLESDKSGISFLNSMKIKGLIISKDIDWNDVRELGIDLEL